MSAVTFLFLLYGLSVVTGLITEVVKKIAKDKAHLAYNIVSLIVALIVGVAGTFVYYRVNAIDINTDYVMYAILIGLSSSIVSQLGYDKVKQAIEQIIGDEKK